MQRFGSMMLEGLRSGGIEAELIRPKPFFGRVKGVGGFVTKWLAYIDKFIVFPFQLRRKLAARPSLVHICDHSNAVYVNRCKEIPTVVTCHDFLAMRGALGEDTDCPASLTGKFLQRWIRSGLGRATAVACVSRSTLQDAERFLGGRALSPRMSVITLGLNYPYQPLTPEVIEERLSEVRDLGRGDSFILHVGSNLRRKNREGVLRIFARYEENWNGRLILAGDPLTRELRLLSDNLGVASRIIEVPEPRSELLEALYNGALALIYPSRFEGFGWPVAEAQACGCPVLCSNSGPLPEVTGGAALLHDVDDEEAFAADIVRLADPAERRKWSEKGLENAKRFSTTRMISEYKNLYRTLAPNL